MKKIGIYFIIAVLLLVFHVDNVFAMQTVSVSCWKGHENFNGTADNYMMDYDNGDVYKCNVHNSIGIVSHNYDSNYKYNSTSHWQECQNPGCAIQQNKGAHEGGIATCETKAVCDVCKQSYGDFKAHDLVKIEKKNATCNEDGYEAYWMCKSCRKYFSDADGKNIISGPQMISRTGHTYGKVIYTWSADNKVCTAERECALCHEKETETVDAVSNIVQAKTCTQPELTTYRVTFENDAFESQIKENVQTASAGHNLVKTEEVAATADQEGNIAYWYCTDCDKYFSDEKAENEIKKEDTILAQITPVITKDDEATVTVTPTPLPTATPTPETTATVTPTPTATVTPKLTDTTAKTSTGTKNSNSTSTETTTKSSPQTGDNSEMQLYVILMLASMCVLGGVCIKRRHKSW